MKCRGEPPLRLGNAPRGRSVPTVDTGLLFVPATGTFGYGSTRLDLSQKGGPPVRCWLQQMLRFKAVDARRRGAAYRAALCYEVVR